GARIEVAADLPDLHCDRTAVEQVLSNLIENAVKYAHPDRPPVVQVTGRRLGEMAEFRVTDNGRGIASADLDHVFEL
ncbi:ATP-binding protein, partial [Acinetobacter baumannii]